MRKDQFQSKDVYTVGLHQNDATVMKFAKALQNASQDVEDVKRRLSNLTWVESQARRAFDSAVRETQGVVRVSRAPLKMEWDIKWWEDEPEEI